MSKIVRHVVSEQGAVGLWLVKEVRKPADYFDVRSHQDVMCHPCESFRMCLEKRKVGGDVALNATAC